MGEPTAAPPRVVLATNGAAAARHATVVAADLAGRWGARLAILHVKAPVEHRVGRLAPTLPVTQRLDNPYEDPVLADARRLAWTAGAAAKPVLWAGDPGPVITALAARVGASVVVIGARRRRGPARLLARTRRWVSTRAVCPVLIGPEEPPTPPAAPVDRGVLGTGPAIAAAG